MQLAADPSHTCVLPWKINSLDRGQLPWKPKQELFDLTLPLQAVFYLFTFANTDLANPCFKRHSQQFCPQPLLVMLCRKVPKSVSISDTKTVSAPSPEKVHFRGLGFLHVNTNDMCTA